MARKNLQVDGNKIPEKQKATFNEVMGEVNMVLATAPEAMYFSVKKNADGAHYWSFDDATKEAQEVREQIREKLAELYQAGAFSHNDFARPLRVDKKAVQALIDDDFREENNIA